MFDLSPFWNWRTRSGVFERSNAVRVFHGPGEGQGEFKSFAIDRFADHYWLTEWESKASEEKLKRARTEICRSLQAQGALSIVGLSRPERGVAPESQVLFGKPPASRFEVKENDCRFWIQLEKTRHPGLFLDHEPLRRWLLRQCEGLKVLNTFSYTGSLSVAAGMGGAKQVTTLDLSQPSIQWAKENFLLNGLTGSSHRFIAGDVFEWLPRLKREKEKFDCIILDPPSFSHGKKGKFSTAQDLERLHFLAMELLNPEAFLVTSINSANVTWKKYESDVCLAAQKLKMNFATLRQIDLPETFPTALGQSASRYLKGWILKRQS